MRKKYQIFISSTYTDLKDERLKVLNTILEMGHIPNCMELFPAANNDSWTVIQKIIDECDYYIVVVGGKYGSMTTEGISYTQMEYEYAVSKGIPVIGFIYENPEELPIHKAEMMEGPRKKLEGFIEIVKKKHIRFWTNGDNLCKHVHTSLTTLFDDYPRSGWSKLNDYNLATNRSEMWEQWVSNASNAVNNLSAVTFSVGPNLKDKQEMEICTRFFNVIENLKIRNPNAEINLLTPKVSALDKVKMNALLWRKTVGFEVRIFSEDDYDELYFRYQVVDEEDIVLNIPNVDKLDRKSEMSVRFNDAKIGRKLYNSFEKIWARSVPLREFLLEEFALKILRSGKAHNFVQLKAYSKVENDEDQLWILDHGISTNRIEKNGDLYQILNADV